MWNKMGRTNTNEIGKTGDDDETKWKRDDDDDDDGLTMIIIIIDDKTYAETYTNR